MSMTTMSVPTLPRPYFPPAASLRSTPPVRPARTTLAQVLLLQAEDDDLPEFWD
jgi:hypothetical protein